MHNKRYNASVILSIAYIFFWDSLYWMLTNDLKGYV